VNVKINVGDGEEIVFLVKVGVEQLNNGTLKHLNNRKSLELQN